MPRDHAKSGSSGDSGVGGQSEEPECQVTIFLSNVDSSDSSGESARNIYVRRENAAQRDVDQNRKCYLIARKSYTYSLHKTI